MRLLDLTLPTPEENLALDEALLDEAEAAAGPFELLRIWESPEPLVVLGRSSQARREVNIDFCRSQGIRVLRRSSGGAAVVVAPGSLMYALVLSYEFRPQLRALDEAHRFVLGKTADALEDVVPGVQHQGTSDLALCERKFSGNSVRCKRRHFLYHGTLMHALDVRLVEQCLAMPPRQPGYRQDRPHESFLTNVNAAVEQLRAALVEAWQADERTDNWPRRRVADLIAQRYGQEEWTFQR